MLTIIALLKFIVPGGIITAALVAGIMFPVTRKFFMASIPMPIVLLIAIGAWLYLDRAEVAKRAVRELVAGAEIDAAKNTIKAQGKILAAEKAERANAVDALLELSNKMLAVQRQNEDLQNEIDDIASHPVATDCRVDAALLERLRNR